MWKADLNGPFYTSTGHRQLDDLQDDDDDDDNDDAGIGTTHERPYNSNY